MKRLAIQSTLLTVLTRGFAAKAPQKIIESVTTWSTEYHAIIEEDQIVEISHPNTH